MAGLTAQQNIQEFLAEKEYSENEKAKLMKGVKRLKNMFASGRVTKIMLKTLSKIST